MLSLSRNRILGGAHRPPERVRGRFLVHRAQQGCKEWKGGPRAHGCTPPLLPEKATLFLLGQGET